MTVKPETPEAEMAKFETEAFNDTVPAEKPAKAEPEKKSDTEADAADDLADAPEPKEAEPSDDDDLSDGAEEADKDEDEDPDADVPDDEQPKPKSKGGNEIKQRIRELTRRRGDAEKKAADATARADALEARLAALERGEKPLTKGKEPAKDEGTSDKPDPDKFEYGAVDPAYIEALADWRVEKRLAEDKVLRDKDRQTEAAERAAREHQSGRAAFVEKASKEFPDFEEVVMDSVQSGSLTISDTMGVMISKSTDGPAIAYHLAKNPKFASETATKSPEDQLVIFGRLQERFAAKRAADKPRAPSAPPPAQHAKGGGTKIATPNDTTDFAAFEAKVARMQRK